jgi:hypothetical protein
VDTENSELVLPTFWTILIRTTNEIAGVELNCFGAVIHGDI